MKSLVSIILGGLAFGHLSYSQVLHIEGEASVPTAAANPTSEEKSETEIAALKNGFQNALQNQSEAMRQQYADRKPGIEGAALSLVTNKHSKITVNATGNTITAIVNGDIDFAAFRDLLNRMPRTTQQVVLSDSEVAVFFTARTTTENKVFRSDSERQENNSGSIETEANQQASQTGVSTSDVEINKVQKRVIEADVTRADVQKFALDGPASESFGSGLTGQFTEKGFKQIVDGAMFETSRMLGEAFGSGNVVPAKVWKAVVQEVRENEPSVKYVIVGTIDFSMPQTDDITGGTLINATVMGKVYQLGQSGLPRQIAGLQPITQKGVAPNQQDAKKRVLAALASLAADEIITKLKNNSAL